VVGGKTRVWRRRAIVEGIRWMVIACKRNWGVDNVTRIVGGHGMGADSWAAEALEEGEVEGREKDARAVASSTGSY